MPKPSVRRVFTLFAVITGTAAAAVWADRKFGRAALPAATGGSVLTPPVAPSANDAEATAGSENKALTAARSEANLGSATWSALSGDTKALLSNYDAKDPLRSKMRMLQRVLALPPDKLASMVREFSGKGRKSDPAWSEVQDALAIRWAQTAPQDALAFATSAASLSGMSRQSILTAIADINPNLLRSILPNLKGSDGRRQVLQTLVNQMAETDPAGALAYAKSYPESQRWSFYSLYSTWASRDPQAALNHLLTNGSTSDQHRIADSVFSAWASQDQPAAVAAARNLQNPSLRMAALGGVMESLVSTNPAGAKAYLDSLSKSERSLAIDASMWSWQHSDPDGLADYIGSIGSDVERQKLTERFLSNAGYNNPELGRRLVGSLPEGAAKQQSIQILLGGWMWADQERATAWLEQLSPQQQSRVSAGVAEQLAGADPKKALEFLAAHPINGSADQVWSNLARSYVANNPAEGFAWLDSLSDESIRRRCLPGALETLAAINPAEAAAKATEIVDDTSRSQSLGRVADAWAANDFEGALAWARSLAGADRAAAMASVLGKGCHQDPAKAAGEIVALAKESAAAGPLPDSVTQSTASVASALFNENEQKAAAWAAGLEVEKMRVAAVQNIATSWAKLDVVAASGWIQSLPAGDAKDGAVAELVFQITASDPEAAFTWAASTQDPVKRSTLVENTLTSWKSQDRSAAFKALQNSSLPPETKERLQKKLAE